MTYAERFARHYIEVEMRADPEEVAALFAADAVLETADRTVAGRENLVAFYREFLAPMHEERVR